ncbi:MAG: hydrogenase expression/formation protein HypE [Pseudobdellovibrionaceae bacterium]
MQEKKKDTLNENLTAQCPLPLDNYSKITLAHGGGGRLTSQLIDTLFRPSFENQVLNQQHDCATIKCGTHRLAFTTDSYVISPLFFAGGNIGKLSVIGTANDLVMGGATPQFLSCSLILEEGFSIKSLSEIIHSMKVAAEEIGIEIVTGDTKVVERGKGDGLYINTAGIGTINHSLEISPFSISPGDAIILSGDIGRHGISILSVREGLEFEGPIESDCAHLTPLVHSLLAENIAIHCLRDLTRGGLATALIELAETAHLTFIIDESKIPVQDTVRGACEILGLDPMYVANEGRFIAIVKSTDAEKALSILQKHPIGANAVYLGQVESNTNAKGKVMARGQFGGTRLIDKFSGEQLPRIC